MVEVVSMANAMDEGRRTESMFGEQAYKSPIIARRSNIKDMPNKNSAFYIRQKIEISICAERLAGKGAKILVITVLVIYMYGALCLKYISGAESFVDGINETFWPEDKKGF